MKEKACVFVQFELQTKKEDGFVYQKLYRVCIYKQKRAPLKAPFLTSMKGSFMFQVALVEFFDTPSSLCIHTPEEVGTENYNLSHLQFNMQ